MENETIPLFGLLNKFAERCLNMISSEQTTIRERFADAFSLPKDLIAGATLLHLVGNSDIYLENFRGIISYTCTEIIIKGFNEKIYIIGECLTISYYSEEDMKISGYIKEITVSKGAGSE